MKGRRSRVTCPRRPGSLVLHLGDLVFFDTDSEGTPRAASHVGIYAGRRTLHPRGLRGQPYRRHRLEPGNPYYSERFIGARRVIPWRPPTLDVLLTDMTRELSTSSPFPSREKMTIRVFNRMSGGGPMDLVVEKRRSKGALRARRAGDVPADGDPPHPR